MFWSPLEVGSVAVDWLLLLHAPSVDAYYKYTWESFNTCCGIGYCHTVLVAALVAGHSAHVRVGAACAQAPNKRLVSHRICSRDPPVTLVRRYGRLQQRS